MERRSAFQRVCPPDFRKYPPNFRKSLASFLCLCYTTSALCLGMLIFRPVPGGFPVGGGYEAPGKIKLNFRRKQSWQSYL